MRSWLLAALLIGTCAATPGTAHQAPPPGLADANARLQANDPDGAAKILEGVTTREPKNVRAWRMLGTALHQGKQYDGAIAAYQKVLALQPSAPVMLYNIGCAYARKNEPDRAFEWLAKAKATGTLDMTQIQTDADLVSLKSDPRFLALLPAPSDFADPFVEPTKVVREWVGEAMQDQFGWIARNLGDIDRDGVPDVITSAPTKDINGANAGRIYAYSTKTGALLWKADGRRGDQLGNGVEGAGDTNRDGIPDAIASAPGAARALGGMFLSVLGDIDADGVPDVYAADFPNSAKGPSTGRIYVHSGRDGRRLLTLTGETAGEGFGIGPATAGDVNGDGHADLIVGAWQYAGAAQSGGRAYLYSGKDGRLLRTITCRVPGDTFGFDAVGMGDVDRDGTVDLLLTSAWSGIKGFHSGRMFIISSGIPIAAPSR